jgi:hypothetical protein
VTFCGGRSQRVQGGSSGWFDWLGKNGNKFVRLGELRRAIGGGTIREVRSSP